jgi:hypothetical protein
MKSKSRIPAFQESSQDFGRSLEILVTFSARFGHSCLRVFQI